MIQGPETDVCTWVEALLQATGQLQGLLLWEAKPNQQAGWGGSGGDGRVGRAPVSNLVSQWICMKGLCKETQTTP